ncbi:MAG: hypothetical protein H7A41_07255 [Chlamydiales bacterium]|nr:hypothetical protein [Chlamydiales bacterium]
MATISTSTDLSLVSGYDPMGDLPVAEIQQPQEKLSEQAQTLADGILGQPASTAPDKKRVYFWVKAKEGDEAFRTKDMDRDREMSIDMFKMLGYEVVVFKTNRAFFDHIKRDPSKVDLLVISDHGTPYRIGDLRVRGENIISTDQELSEEEREHGFQRLSSIMKEGSIVLLDGCLTGNKTVERNIAKVASEIIPQTTVYASQHVTEYEPGYFFEEGKDGKPVITNIYYGNRGDTETMVKPVDATVYRKGVELTGQDPVEIPPELFARRRSSGYNPYVIGALVVGAIATAVGIGAWWFNKSQAS